MRAGFFACQVPWSPGSLCRGRCEMERLPRYSGTAGIISAFLLLLFLILGFVVPGTGATFADPVRTLTFIAQNRWEWLRRGGPDRGGVGHRRDRGHHALRRPAGHRHGADDPRGNRAARPLDRAGTGSLDHRLAGLDGE